MSDYASLMISFVALVWVVFGIVNLEFDSLVEDKPATLRDVIAAFTLEPLLIFIGVRLSGVPLTRLRYFLMQSDKAICLLGLDSSVQLFEGLTPELLQSDG